MVGMGEWNGLVDVWGSVEARSQSVCSQKIASHWDNGRRSIGSLDSLGQRQTVDRFVKFAVFAIFAVFTVFAVFAVFAVFTIFAGKRGRGSPLLLLVVCAVPFVLYTCGKENRLVT